MATGNFGELYRGASATEPRPGGVSSGRLARVNLVNFTVSERQHRLGYGEGTFPPPVIGEVQRPYSELLSDIFTSAFPTWRFSANVSYPLGQSTADASLARTRLETRQSQTNLRNLELQVVTQVRDAGRQLVANSKRVDSTPRLDATSPTRPASPRRRRLPQ